VIKIDDDSMGGESSTPKHAVRQHVRKSTVKSPLVRPRSKSQKQV